MKFNSLNYLSTRIMLTFILLFTIILTLLIALGSLTIEKDIGRPYFFIGCVLTFMLPFLFYFWIYKPYKKNQKVLQLFVDGYTINEVFAQDVSLSPEMKEVINKVQEIMETYELLNANKKQAQYLALQNQINPHFLYNTLEGIRGEALSAGLGKAAKMLEALSTFFRYTISNLENLVTLEDELRNVYNYFIIQQYRFGERLKLSVEYNPDDESDILSCRVPKLILQPIVENAINHGVERKIGIGKIRIKIECTKKRLIITVSDNGVGIAEEPLKKINNKLQGMSFDYIKQDDEKHGGIAIENVNSRIKLLFGEEYGIYLYSSLNVGTDVEITLPRVKEGNEVFYEG